ncbi:MAG: 30S ribosomal protein S6 [Candidatus Komeilibacteria bacterium]|nr:30S ribosomal protein S6 [Candidatus Komeilibacteria bacterium]
MQTENLHYDLTLIIPATAAENEHPEIVGEIKALLEKTGATNLQTQDLGRKKLAYAIKNLRHGFYFSFEFNLGTEKLQALDLALKLHKNVLRHLIIKKKIKSAKDMAREEKIRTGKLKQEHIKQETEEKEKRQAVKAAKPKISLEDLDKKLDELLDEKVI